MQYVHYMESGIARLFTYLANIKNFPTSLRAASTVSGVPEEMIPGILNGPGATGFKVYNNSIYLNN